MTDEQISIFTLASDGLPDGTALWQFYSAKMQKILLYFSCWEVQERHSDFW